MIFTYLALIAAAIGVVSHLVAGIGIIRFPDVYTRVHAIGISTTFGTGFITLAIFFNALSNWNEPNMIIFFHVLIGAVAVLFTNPTAAYVIARITYLNERRMK